MKRRILLLIPLLGLFGCGQDEPITPAPRAQLYQGTLGVDIRGHAELSLSIPVSAAPSVELTVDSVNAAGLLPATTKLSAGARVEAFPENDSVLYSAKFSQPAVSGGPCGDQPISLSLSLHRRGAVTRVGGSLTAYCGKDHFFGVPVKMLRLSGELPLK